MIIIMKKLFLLLMLLPLTLAANAQNSAAKTIEAGEGQQWWGYYKGSEELKGMGYGINGHYDVAIFIPGDEGVTKDATIHAVRFFITTTNNLNNVKVWASKQLPEKGKPETADIEVKSLSKDEIIVRTEGTNDVAFTPFKVPEQGVYVGYSFDITSIGSEDTYYPVVVTKGTEDINNALWLYVSSNTSWVNCYDWGGKYGNLALKVLISGDMEKNAVEAVSAEDAVTLKGSSANVPLNIFNWGADGVTSLGYTVTTDGIESEEMSYTLENPFNTFHSDTTILLPIPADEVAVKKQKTITIKKVNGQDNEVEPAQRSTTTSLITVAEPTLRRVVMEEFTGTWCGWCVRGIKGIELSNELFGEQFIPIAVHGSDIMTIPEYSGLRQNVGGLPTSLINRYYECDPYYGRRGIDPVAGSKFGVDEDIRNMLAETVEGSVYSSAILNTEGSNMTIDLTTETTFQFSADDAHYAIGYVLLANDPEGPGKDWVQENFYTRYQDNEKYNKDENLQEYINGSDKIRDMLYQHVPIAGLGVDNGIEGSITAPISLAEIQTYKSTLNITGNTLMQDANKLDIVTLLINTKTGRIVNAHKTAVIPYDPTSVDSLTAKTDNGKSQVFTIDGRLVSKPQPGINIIKNSDGTIRKQVVR